METDDGFSKTVTMISYYYLQSTYATYLKTVQNENIKIYFKHICCRSMSIRRRTIPTAFV